MKNGTLLSSTFLKLTVNTSGERGLLGIAFDPAFATNKHLYLYYTATTPVVHNRVSRFTANGDRVVAGSERVIFDLPAPGDSARHNGGAIRFGADGKLYIAVGDNQNGANSQSLSSVFGKLLRINKDGSIPSSNPFFTSTTGKNRAIWALGLRNPFNFDVQRGAGRIFINDAGEDTWEEINDGIAGSNYGWPLTEGPTDDPRFRGPVFSYGQGNSATEGCVITGGTFYNPATVQLPSAFVGDYFFADFCSGWIRRFDPETGNAHAFATGIDRPVALAVAKNGALLYLARGSTNNGGRLVQVRYTGG